MLICTFVSLVVSLCGNLIHSYEAISASRDSIAFNSDSIQSFGQGKGIERAKRLGHAILGPVRKFSNVNKRFDKT